MQWHMCDKMGSFCVCIPFFLAADKTHSFVPKNVEILKQRKNYTRKLVGWTSLFSILNAAAASTILDIMLIENHQAKHVSSKIIS